MKQILILFLALAQVASAQNTFKPMPATWDNAQVMGTTTLGNRDIVVYGYGQFLPEPAPQHGCLIRDGQVLPLPWEIPPNTADIVEDKDGAIYTSGSLGVYKITGSSCERIVPATSFIECIYIHAGKIFFGGSVATIDSLIGNIGSYDLATGEIKSSLLPGDIRSIVSYDMPNGDEYLVALSSLRDSSIQVVQLDLTRTPLQDSSIIDARSYIGREMKVINNKLYVTCWEYDNNGFLAVYDGYEWEYSLNIGLPSIISVSPEGDIYVSGSLFYDGEISFMSHVPSLGQWDELVDDKGREIYGSFYGQETFLAWDDERMYVILGVGGWIEGYQFREDHFFRLDDEMVEVVRPENAFIYPNPSNGNFTVELPGRVLEYLEIYDIQGNLVYREAVYGRKFHLSLNLERGTYILKCGEYTGKIIIAH